MNRFSLQKISRAFRSIIILRRLSEGSTGDNITIRWRKRDGTLLSTPAKDGENLMRLAHRYGIELEGLFTPT